ncbi:MAG TPA: hypothetical protein VJJ81_01510 [Candidatus Babeliales bacterium]|nr:hypothetical protein [Candidatus Babeliales bacterium]
MTPIKRPQHNPGFSFMEIMIALCMIGLVLTALFGLQNSVFKQIGRAHKLTQQSLALQYLLIDHNFLNNLFTNTGPIEKRLESLGLELKATFSAPAVNSKLEKFANIRIVKLAIDNGETLVMAVHLPQLAEAEKDSENNKIKVESTPDAQDTNAPKTGDTNTPSSPKSGSATPPTPKSNVSKGR